MSSRTNIVLLLGFLVLSLPGCKPDPNAPPIFRDAGEYQAAVDRVQVLTKGPFEALHEGQPISEREKIGLKEADKLIDGMIAYNPEGYPPYILRGLTKRAMGDLDGAKLAYEQGLALSPKAPNAVEKAAIGRTYDEMATLYFEKQDYKEAEEWSDKAVNFVPNDPSLLTNAASVKIQLNKKAEAIRLLDTALRAAPNYERAKSLLKFVNSAH